ncbi:MAG: DnaJ domain-containing protein [Sedimentisphaerales bacterium]|nr:DnaJ domain-containing protein [Sedimentisphaerales bacterium]
MSKKDYYDVLGVPSGASADQIKKAYRRLARKFHPDATGNDKKAAERFKEAQEAYDSLSDPQKRQAYDTFGHAAANMGSGPFGGGPGAGRSYARRGGSDGIHFDFSDFFGGSGGVAGHGGIEDIFEQLRSQQGRRVARKRPQPQRGRDIEHTVRISFDEAVNGVSRDIVMTVTQSDNKRRQERLAVKIPPGVDNGSKIRLRGKGQPGPGGRNGDLLITIQVDEHPYFERQGNDIYLEVPMSVTEAALGTRIEVPTLSGTSTVTIPPGSSSGRKLRLKGKGIKSQKTKTNGDMFLTLKIVPPVEIDEDSKQLLQDFAKENPQPDLRKNW